MFQEQNDLFQGQIIITTGKAQEEKGEPVLPVESRCAHNLP